MKMLLIFLLLLSRLAQAQTSAARSTRASKTTASSNTVYSVIENNRTTFWKRMPGTYKDDYNMIKAQGFYFLVLDPSDDAMTFSNAVQPYIPAYITGIGSNMAVAQADQYTSTISITEANNKGLAATLLPPDEDRYGPILLTGTKEERSFARYVLDQIKFPFDKLKITTAKIQFKEGIMNGGNYGVTDMLGVATIDASLVGNMTTGVHNIMCEVAHIVDSGWLTDSMRKTIVNLVAKGDTRITWFPDYNKLNDYRNLISECFHQIFITSYTDYPNPSRLNHWITSEQAPVIRKVLRVERTDAQNNKGK